MPKLLHSIVELQGFMVAFDLFSFFMLCVRSDLLFDKRKMIRRYFAEFLGDYDLEQFQSTSQVCSCAGGPKLDSNRTLIFPPAINIICRVFFLPEHAKSCYETPLSNT